MVKFRTYLIYCHVNLKTICSKKSLKRGIYLLDVETELVMIKGRDKTNQIEEYTELAEKTRIKFKGNNQIFNYHKANVIRFSDPDFYDGHTYVVFKEGIQLNQVKTILRFEHYDRIIFENGHHCVYASEIISVEKRTLSKPNVHKKWKYLKELSEKVGIIQDDGTSI